MSMSDNKNGGKIGDVVYEWSDIDHIKPIRGPIWYLGFFIVMASFCLWGFIEGVYSFSLVILVISFFVVYMSGLDPIKQKNSITTLGVKIGKQFIPYSAMGSFWFIHYDNINILNIGMRNSLAATVKVPVLEGDPSMIRDLLLGRNISEVEGKGENLAESLVRILKL